MYKGLSWVVLGLYYSTAPGHMGINIADAKPLSETNQGKKSACASLTQMLASPHIIEEGVYVTTIPYDLTDAARQMHGINNMGFNIGFYKNSGTRTKPIVLKDMKKMLVWLRKREFNSFIVYLLDENGNIIKKPDANGVLKDYVPAFGRLVDSAFLVTYGELLFDKETETVNSIEKSLDAEVMCFDAAGKDTSKLIISILAEVIKKIK